jgi:hypothetical protein
VFIRGNSKLGEDVWTWSILAGHTCPGKSAPCLSECYALHGHFVWASTIASHQSRWEHSLKRSFVKDALAELEKLKPKVLRVHVAGDFYSPAYVRKWHKIIEATPGTQFFLFSRSWRVPNILRELRKLAGLKNVCMWFSCDQETGAPPLARNVRRAYMSLNDDDAPLYRVDLVFRAKRGTTQKFNKRGHFVCPVEQGIVRQKHITCSTCRLCFTPGPMPRKEPQRAARQPTLASV